MTEPSEVLGSLFNGDANLVARAIIAGDAEAVSATLTPTALSARGKHGVTLTLLAVRCQHTECLKVLLSAGADPTVADDNGWTAVHLAAAARNADCLVALLENGADPNITNPVTGERPLSVALTNDRQPQFQLLLAWQADPDLADHEGSTALHRAALVDDAARVLDLLEAGADPQARNQQGRTFQDYLWMTPLSMYAGAAKAARLKVQYWLRRHDLPVSEPSHRGSASHEAQA